MRNPALHQQGPPASCCFQVAPSQEEWPHRFSAAPAAPASTIFGRSKGLYKHEKLHKLGAQEGQRYLRYLQQKPKNTCEIDLGPSGTWDLIWTIKNGILSPGT